MRILLSFFITVFLTSRVPAQTVVKVIDPTNYSNKVLSAIREEYGKNKEIPKIFEQQILIALSYFPELKDTHIEFRVKKANSPLSARPKVIGLFTSAKKRKYVITISESADPKLESILFNNLSFNAQIGVLGHELSHISDYSTKGFAKMCNLLFIELFSKKEVDKFESRTDLICISHGLGYQLFDWSFSVRQNLNTDYWRGASNINCTKRTERYLNPSTINNILLNNPLYKEENKTSNL